MNTKSITLAVALALQAVFTVSNAGAQIADPVVTVTGGASQQTITATVTESTGGATLHYTMDGSAPTLSSASIASGNSLLLSQNANLNVQAFTSSTTTSNLVTTQYNQAGQVSAGTRHSLALDNNGNVWAWGDNTYGELGNGTTNNSSTPLEVSGLPTVVAVAAGQDESFAVDSSGNVWAWGYNPNGQLGMSSTASSVTVPTQVSSLTGIVAIASAGYHTLALQTNGTVWAFGADSSGQVGNGTTASVVSSPVQLSLQGIVALATGANHSLALDNTGRVWAWGSNTYGQLGLGNNTTESSPVEVGSSLSGVVAIAAGTEDSYAAEGNGTAWAWGDNSIGELGNGTTTGSKTPTQVSSSTGSIAAISNQTSVASTGQVYTWGDNTDGRLGTGSAASYVTLPQMVGGTGIPAASFWTLVTLGAVLLTVMARKISPRKPMEA